MDKFKTMTYEKACEIFIRHNFEFCNSGDLQNVKVGDLIAYKKYKKGHIDYLVLSFCKKPGKTTCVIVVNPFTYAYDWLTEAELTEYNVVSR